MAVRLRLDMRIFCSSMLILSLPFLISTLTPKTGVGGWVVERLPDITGLVLTKWLRGDGGANTRL
jgi:hypothetical protein